MKSITRVIAGLSSAAVLLSLTGCGNKEKESDSDYTFEQQTTAELVMPELTMEDAGEGESLTEDTQPAETEAPDTTPGETIIEEHSDLAANTVEFGTAEPVPFRDSTTDELLSLKMNGQIEYLPFFDGEEVTDTKEFEAKLAQKAISAFGVKAAELAASGVSFEELSAYTPQIAQGMTDILLSKGYAVTSVMLNSISAK